MPAYLVTPPLGDPQWRYGLARRQLHLLAREQQGRLDCTDALATYYFDGLPVLTLALDGTLTLRSCGYHRSRAVDLLNLALGVLGHPERLVLAAGRWFVCGGPQQGTVAPYVGEYGLEYRLTLSPQK